MRGVLFLFLFYISCGGLAANDLPFHRYITGFDSQGQADLSHLTTALELKFSALSQTQANSSYQGFIDYLFAAEPGFKRQHIMVHGTGSLQHGTLTHPRVLIFAPGVIFSFSENPRTEKRRVEMMEFDSTQSKFSFNEIVFNPGQAPEFHGNPAKCTTCHGQERKPIWNQYDLWPDTYGSHIGRVVSDHELQAYDRLRLQRPDGIFQKIEIEEARPQRLPQEGVESFTQLVNEANNMRIGKEFARLAQSPQGSALKAFMPAIFAITQGCSADETFGRRAPPQVPIEQLVPSAAAALLGRDKDFFLRDSAAAREWQGRYLARRYAETFPGNRIIGSFNYIRERLQREAVVVGQLRWILENLGVSWRELAPGHGINSYFMSVPGNFQIGLLGAYYLQSQMAAIDLVAQIPLRFTPLGGINKNILLSDCQSLAQLSRERLANWQGEKIAELVIEEFSKPSQKDPVLGRCLKCHVGGRETVGFDVPYIPFDKTTELSALLRDPDSGLYDKIVSRITTTGRGRMPPVRSGLPALTLQEQAAFIEVLDDLRE